MISSFFILMLALPQGQTLSTQDLQRNCLIQNSNGENEKNFDARDYRTCDAQPSDIDRKACIAGRANNSNTNSLNAAGCENGDVDCFCLKQIKAQCASVAYAEAKIVGCSQYNPNKIKTPIGNGQAVPTPGNRPATATSPKSKGPSAGSNSSSAAGPSSASAPGSAENAKQQCQALYNSARQACSNTQDLAQESAQLGSPPSSGEGLRAYCAHYRQLTNAGYDSNIQAGDQCFSAYSTCSDTCEGFASEQRGRDSGAANTLAGLAASCRQFQSVASASGRQALSYNESSQAAQACQSQSATASASSGDLRDLRLSNGMDAFFDRSTPASDDRPMDISAGAKAAEALEAGRAKASSGESSAGGFSYSADGNAHGRANTFNLPGSDSSARPLGPSGVSSGRADNIPTTERPPNNSGGAIPTGPNAAAPGNAVAPSARQGLGLNPDIDHGFVGVSGGGSNGGNNGGGSGFSLSDANTPERRPLSASKTKSERYTTNLDLKRYLPGGDLDPQRPGGAMRRPIDIHGPSANLFEKIHIRYDQRCRLGLLLGCENGPPR
jgi:hypothetical protein